MPQTITILGAGFGGLRAAMLLGKAIRRHKMTDFRITLVDRNDYHTYTPLLYEVGASPEEMATYLDMKSIVTFPLAEVLGKYDIEVVRDAVIDLDVVDGRISLESGKVIGYDYLILAMGSETNFYDIPGLRETALSLKTFDDAIRIRDAIWQSSCTLNRLRIVVGGGGSTGVELASELQPWLNEITQAGSCRTGITLLHAGSTVLSGFPLSVVDKVAARLAWLKVKVLTDEKVVAVEKEAHVVQLEGGMRVPFDILIWTAGVKPNSILAGLPVRYERGNHIAVASDLSLIPENEQMRLHGKIYAVGDVVHMDFPGNGRSVPMTARNAISQASVAARNIIAHIRGRPAIAYRPRDYPFIIPVGGKHAVAKIGPLVLSGFAAWLFKGVVELNYLLAILPPLHAMRIWLRGLRIFILNDRLG